MTLNCILIFIATGSFLYWCVIRPASQCFFIHSCIYLRTLIISYLATFLGINGLSVLMCRKAVNQSIDFDDFCICFRSKSVLCMTLNCILIFIVTGSFLYWCVMRPASQRFFIYTVVFIYESYLAKHLGTNSLYVLLCRKAVNQSINYLQITIIKIKL